MKEELEEIFLKELELNKNSLLRVCSAYATDPEMRKDYFQESILNIWKSLPSFNGKSSLKTWMYRITINVCLGLHHKRKSKNFDYIEFLEDKCLINQGKEMNIKIEMLRKCVSQLDMSNKTIILLYLEELPYKEISNITGLTENHIAVKIKRIKKKLLHCINQVA